MPDLDLWAYDGPSAIKALDDDGRFEGLAAPFGDADRSRMRDIFSASTTFGRALKTGADVLMNHGLATVGGKPNTLADVVLGEAEFEVRPDGLWTKGRLDLRDPAVREVWAGVRSGTYKLSTGSAPHMVRRVPNGDGTHSIKAWPVVELSITDSPAHPRTSIYAIKSAVDDLSADAVKAEVAGLDPDPVPESPAERDAPVAGPSLLDRSARLVADLDELVPLFERAHAARLAEGRDLSPEKLAALKALGERVHLLAAAARPRVDPEILAALHREADELLAMQR